MKGGKPAIRETSILDRGVGKGRKKGEGGSMRKKEGMICLVEFLGLGPAYVRA